MLVIEVIVIIKANDFDHLLKLVSCLVTKPSILNLKMKLCSFLALATLLQVYSNVCGEDCMSVSQLLAATRILCQQQRNNKVLWQQVIDCHKPMSDEVKYIVLLIGNK